MCVQDHCKSGEALLKRLERWEDISSAELQVYEVKVRSFWVHLEEFSQRVEDTKEKIDKSVRLYEFFDKARFQFSLIILFSEWTELRPVHMEAEGLSNVKNASVDLVNSEFECCLENLDMNLSLRDLEVALRLLYLDKNKSCFWMQLQVEDCTVYESDLLSEWLNTSWCIWFCVS